MAFSEIMPKLSSSLANWGIEKLGTSLGLDPRISSLIGTPISAGINIGLQNGANTGQNIINAINNGILSGVVNLGINYGGDVLHLNPLLTGVSANLLGGAISGLFGIQQIDPSDPNHLVKPANMFEGISNAFLRGLSSTLTLGGVGQNSWSQAQYIQRVDGFSNIVRSMGLVKAIDTYAAGMFQQSAIEEMMTISGSVGNYIQAQLSSGNYVTKNEEGYQYKYILLPGSKNKDPYSNNFDTAYIKVDTTQGHEGVYGYADNGYSVDGELDLMSSGGLGLSGGSSETLYNGSRYIQKWYGGKTEFTNIISQDNSILGTYYAENNSPNLVVANKGQFIDGKFIDQSSNAITIQGSKIVSYQKSITQEGVGDFVSDLVQGLSLADQTVKGMQLSAGKGVLKTFLSDDYKNVGSAPTAASLANYVGAKANEYYTTYYNVQTADFQRFASLFGDVGNKVSDLYDGFMKVEGILGTSVVNGLVDGAYFGTEIPYIMQDTGKAYQALKTGDVNTASELMGSIGTRLFREGSRLLELTTLGLTAAGKAMAKETTALVSKEIVQPLSRETNFYVRPNGDIIPANAYKYISEDATYLDDLLQAGEIAANPDKTYFTFNKFNTPSEAASHVQVPHDASIRAEFDTDQILNSLEIPNGKRGQAEYLEPLVKDFREFGEGGATQAVTTQKIKLKRIVDLKTGKVLKEF